jgi:D-alanyl-lipoteichoic acid acyltransferase DltB (MBOAT superfamily)
MLFNSIEFIFAFLPLTCLIYFLLNRFHFYGYSKVWLLFASLFFYGWWNPKYLILLAVSITINFLCAKKTAVAIGAFQKKTFLVTGLMFNLGLLVYYKYADFFIENVNTVSGSDFNLLHVILPLGISFFTFQQIAYLVDSYKGKVEDFNFLHYAVFVTFFPQLISGPIVHHKVILPQLVDKNLAHPQVENITKGIFLFQIGLAKKIIIADTFGKLVSRGYLNFESLDTIQAWITTFAYSLQLYFDFSGYADMAIGLGLLFNFKITNNFWSPHKSENIQQFYRRWHITLSNFLRDYLYIPLGGNRFGETRMHLNLFLTFFLGGLWHGANWTFAIWGALNGLGLIFHRLFQKTKIHIPHIIAVLITFLFVLLMRVFFRAEDLNMALVTLKSMFGFAAPLHPFDLIVSIYDAPIWLAGVVMLFLPNSTEVTEKFETNSRYLFYTVLLILLNLIFLNSAGKQDFLYFDF